MGGLGSGRRWHVGCKDTTHGQCALDVRQLKRESLLIPSSHRRITWYRGGEEYVSVNVAAEYGRVVITDLQTNDGDQRKLHSYPVKVTTTPCAIGGERPWFCCPRIGCGKRVALLYYCGVFACRHCHQLAYPSQREDEADRARRKADRIRDRLGWPRGLWHGSNWGKPKGMHWTTYERLRAEHQCLEDTVNAAFIARAIALFPFIERNL